MRSIFGFSCAVLLCSCITATKTDTSIKVGVPSEWGELIPALQHSAYADAILSNEYETLVRIGAGGLVEPLLAKSWTIKEHYTVFEFKIDSKKKFSNGKPLTSYDFKKSWESALSVIPKSANNSLRDVLYKVAGFDEFDKTGSLQGLRTPDETTLIIEFKRPFRTALVYLAGARMAAYIKEKEEYLGTGPYVLFSQSYGKAEYIRNQFATEHGGFARITYEVVAPNEAIEALKANKIQLYIFAEKTSIDECYDNSSVVSCYLGSVSRHSTLILNGRKGSFFANLKHRKAIQALMYEAVTAGDLPSHLKSTLIVDPQIYLPLQAGQIEKSDADKIIREGQKYITEFKNQTKKRPLLVTASQTESWIFDYLKKRGVALHLQSAIAEGEEIRNIYYKSFKSDLLVLGLAVVSGDPDGIFHALGKDGSIASPMSYRPELARLLEQGRSILDAKLISPHYQKVTRAALEEVPFVHLGFLKTRMAYRKDVIQVNKNVTPA
ncbi:MAG: hypothetical protein K2Q26_13690 [Bdellovibrionales bacterium]|nr:hypothetical protein [Bdellovibrionales bacterium]